MTNAAFLSTIIIPYKPYEYKTVSAYGSVIHYHGNVSADYVLSLL